MVPVRETGQGVESADLEEKLEGYPSQLFPSSDVLCYYESQPAPEPLVVRNVKREPATGTLLKPVPLVVRNVKRQCFECAL